MQPKELLADFGPYQLVVRLFGAEYIAVLWRTGGEGPAQRLLTTSAPTLDGAKEALEQKFYEDRLQHPGSIDDVTYARAYTYLWPRLTERQREMIQAQYRANAMTLTTMELAAVVGWNSHSPVNLWYGLAGFALFGEVPREICERNALGAPVFSFALSTGERKTESGQALWSWTLRPEVARGLALAGCV